MSVMVFDEAANLDEEAWERVSRRLASKVRVLNYQSILAFLPFAWERWVEDLKAALERERLGLFDGAVIAPRVSIVDEKPSRYESTDVVFCLGRWHCAFPLELPLDDAAAVAKKLTDTAIYRLDRYTKRRGA